MTNRQLQIIRSGKCDRCGYYTEHPTLSKNTWLGDSNPKFLCLNCRAEWSKIWKGLHKKKNMKNSWSEFVRENFKNFIEMKSSEQVTYT